MNIFFLLAIFLRVWNYEKPHRAFKQFRWLHILHINGCTYCSTISSVRTSNHTLSCRPLNRQLCCQCGAISGFHSHQNPAYYWLIFVPIPRTPFYLYLGDERAINADYIYWQLILQMLRMPSLSLAAHRKDNFSKLILNKPRWWRNELK